MPPQVLSGSSSQSIKRLSGHSYHNKYLNTLQCRQRMAAHIQAHGHAHPSGRLLWGGVKEFADGSLGGRTALMWQPYQDANAAPCATPTEKESTEQQPEIEDASREERQGMEFGTRMLDMDELYKLAQGADAAGLTVAVHAIGDRAVDEVLDVFHRVRKANAGIHTTAAPNFISTCEFNQTCSEGESNCQMLCMGPRHRLEHMQHLSGADAVRAAVQLGVTATPNPLHLVADGDLMVRRLGEERAGAERSYAFKTQIEAGLRAGLSTDWPVTDLHPIGGVYAATTRRDPFSSDSVLYGSETESVRAGQALLGHTREAAYTALVEDYVGSLRPGLRADMVRLTTSPLAMKTGVTLPEVRQTFLDGSCVYGCH